MQSQSLILQIAAKAAIVNSEGKVLIVRESALDPNNTNVGLWSLVGGRLEPGESFAYGLKREVLEETGLNITPMKPVDVGEWRPVIRGAPHQIIAIFMLCTTTSKKVQLSTEHDKYAWIEPKDRNKYSIMKPDCFVIDKLISNRLIP